MEDIIYFDKKRGMKTVLCVFVLVALGACAVVGPALRAPSSPVLGKGPIAVDPVPNTCSG